MLFSVQAGVKLTSLASIGAEKMTCCIIYSTALSELPHRITRFSFLFRGPRWELKPWSYSNPPPPPPPELHRTRASTLPSLADLIFMFHSWVLFMLSLWVISSHSSIFLRWTPFLQPKQQSSLDYNFAIPHPFSNCSYACQTFHSYTVCIVVRGEDLLCNLKLV